MVSMNMARAAVTDVTIAAPQSAPVAVVVGMLAVLLGCADAQHPQLRRAARMPWRRGQGQSRRTETKKKRTIRGVSTGPMA
jgi:hypothetical protein